jgi:hypothetical protein
VLWAKNVVLARRSQTRGDEVLEATKNATRFRVTLPAEVMDILRWHADPRPRPTGGGRWSRPAQHLRPPHRGDDGALTAPSRRWRSRRRLGRWSRRLATAIYSAALPRVPVVVGPREVVEKWWETRSVLP